MKILVSPDSFKGSLAAVEAAAAIAEGWRRARPDDEVVELPIADGGEGTVDTIINNTDGRKHRLQVCGPLREPVQAEWGTIDDGRTAIVEMASASGLLLVSKEKRNPMETTTYGTGEIIAEAARRGCTSILIGIGGSATTDAGAGMAQALGYRFLREDGSEIPRGASGKHLAELASIDRSHVIKELERVKVRVACDVTNPLHGKRGAAHVYGPQKGADDRMVEELDRGLRRFAEVVERDLGVAVAEMEGAGAAGGLGAGLVAFCGAELVSGIDTILETVGFDEKMKGVGLVISGEGKLDLQTVQGKAISGILKRTKPKKIPLVILAGVVEGDEEEYRREGVKETISFGKRAKSDEDSIRNAAKYLADAAEELARDWKD